MANLVTPGGRVVVVAGDYWSEAFGKALEGLSREERQQLRVTSVCPWNAERSDLPTVFSHED